MIDPLQLVTAVAKNRPDTMGQDKQRVTILVKNLETLVFVSPFQRLIWVSQWSLCFKIRVAQHWGGRRHISGGETSMKYKSQDFSRKFEKNGVCFNDL